MSNLPQETLEFAGRLFDCARHGDGATLIAAIDAGLSANILDSRGNSFLMLAAYHGHYSLCRSLLERGADPNILNARGQSILAGAIFKHEMDIVSLLIQFDADPDIGQPSARDSAVMFKNTDAQRLFS